MFKEKPHPKSIDKEKLKEFTVSVSEVNKLRLGLDALDEKGNTIANNVLTLPAYPQRSYAYCSDTNYFEDIIEQVKEVNLLYHEATFLVTEIERAKKTFHTTATQAATIANKANVKQLLVGHFSARYGSIDGFMEEAQAVFANTLLAQEGMTYQVV